MVAIQSVGNQAVSVNCVNKRIRVNAHACSVDDNLVDLRQTLQKHLNTGSYQNEHLNGSAFNNNSHLKISSASGFARLKLCDGELAVN